MAYGKGLNRGSFLLTRTQRTGSISADRSAPLLDPSLHDSTPIGKSLRRAMGECYAAVELSVEFHIHIGRMSRTARDGAKIALLFDPGKIVAGGRFIPEAQFKLELRAEDAASLTALSKQWDEAHRLWLRTDSKAARGLVLARGELFDPLVGTSARRMIDGPDGWSFLAATIQSCMTQVMGNAIQIGAGGLDEELVHQLRTGLIHLHTALTDLHASRFGADPAWPAALRTVILELGAHRDREVVLPSVVAKLFKRGCSPLNHAVPAHTIRPPAEVSSDPSLQQTLLSIFAFLHRPLVLSAENLRHRLKARSLVAHELDRLHRAVAHDVERFRDLWPARQHLVRKRLGRLLFIGSAAESLFESKRSELYLACATRAEALLGKWHDLYVTDQALSSGQLQGPGAGFARDWLRKSRRRKVKQCQRALRKAMNEAVFWR